MLKGTLIELHFKEFGDVMKELRSVEVIFIRFKPLFTHNIEMIRFLRRRRQLGGFEKVDESGALSLDSKVQN